MNKNKLSLKGLSVWFVCVLFFLYEFLLRTILGTFQDPLMNDLGLNSFQFSLLSSSSFLFAYGLMQIAIGPLMLRFGIKKTMLFATFICTISTLGFSLSGNYYIALVFRLLMGFGAAFGFIGVLVAVYDWMPYKYIALFVGLSQFLGTIGPMAAGGPLNALAQKAIVTWHTMFYSLSLAGIVLFLLISLFVDKNKTDNAPFTILKRPRDLRKELISLGQHSQVWFIVIFCAFIYFSLEYLSENEGKNLLIAKGFSADFSAYMISISWLGFALGSPLFGFLSDKLRRRKPILLLSATVTVLSLISIIYLPLHEIGTSISFFFYGLAVGASSVGIVLMGEQFNSENISTGLGLNNAITILFVSLMAPCMSYLLDFFAQNNAYNLGVFKQAFLILILLPAVALILGAYKIKETFGKSSAEPIILNYKTDKGILIVPEG